MKSQNIITVVGGSSICQTGGRGSWGLGATAKVGTPTYYLAKFVMKTGRK